MILLIIVVAAVIAFSPPPPYAPPDLAGCSMAHGFVIGEAPEFPGSVEIWKCPRQTVVTLNQMQGLGDDRKPVTRSHFSPDAAPGEQLMGCRGQDENYDGTVAVRIGAGGGKPQLRRAWKADVEKWAFVGIPPVNLVCNRGLTVN
jgi:hypothetical protein